MGVIDTLKFEIKQFDWRSQIVNGKKVSDIIVKIENGYWRTKKIKINIDIINTSAYGFKCDDLFEFMKHMKLVEKANLKYPVIVNYKGAIIDGRHRLVKAILAGKKTIDGIMLLEDIGENL